MIIILYTFSSFLIPRILYSMRCELQSVEGAYRYTGCAKMSKPTCRLQFVVPSFRPISFRIYFDMLLPRTLFRWISTLYFHHCSSLISYLATKTKCRIGSVYLIHRASTNPYTPWAIKTCPFYFFDNSGKY